MDTALWVFASPEVSCRPHFGQCPADPIRVSPGTRCEHAQRLQGGSKAEGCPEHGEQKSRTRQKQSQAPSQSTKWWRIGYSYSDLVFDTLSKINEMSLLLQGKQLAVFMPMKKFEILGENRILGNLNPPLLTASQTLRDFSDQTGSNI